jgi:hypothetical protein
VERPPKPADALNPGGFELFRGDALDAYRTWPALASIISDGVRGFHGDTVGPEALPLPRWRYGSETQVTG